VAPAPPLEPEGAAKSVESLLKVAPTPPPKPPPAPERCEGAETACAPLSPDQARTALLRFRKDVIERAFPRAEPNRCILRDEIIEALIKGGGDSREAFLEVVPQFMRERVDPRQTRFLDDVYEVIGRISADEPPVADRDGVGADAAAFRPYREARLIGDIPADIANCGPRALINAVLQIVRQEEPIHVEEIARRLQRNAGGERARRRVVEAVGKACELACRRGAVRSEGSFWRCVGTGPIRPRSRALSSPTLRDIDMIAPSEIREAARLFVGAESPSNRAELVRRVGRALGYSRVTEKIAGVILREVLKVTGKNAT